VWSPPCLSSNRQTAGLPPFTVLQGTRTSTVSALTDQGGLSIVGAFTIPTIHGSQHLQQSPTPVFPNIAARASACRSNHIIPEELESGSWRQHTSKAGKPVIGIDSNLPIRITS